ncbi:MAG: 50S ribosome-binding GTPase [Gemmataceae bacterium]|nr:50S ribosome-binding GTPase [Gemmataceae bacterium]
MLDSPTFVSRLTPPGTGAIAVLTLHGPKTWDIVRAVFRPRGRSGTLPERAEPGQVWVGEAGTAEMADECVLVVEEFEPVPHVELHCHGGREVVAWLIELLTSHGAQWSETERQPAERLWRLVEQAVTVRTAAILLDQAQGAWEREMEALSAAWARQDLEEVRNRVTRLEGWVELGRHLIQPWRVVVAGAPNVGKSSLVNAMAGFQRSIVAPIPGTTRDVVTTTIAIDGWPVELLDTAGWRETAHELERAAIEKAHATAAAADLVVWVYDATVSDPEMPEGEMLRRIVVANKCDLPTVSQDRAEVCVSARTGSGIATLMAEMIRRLIPHEPEPGAAIPILPEHQEALRVWRERLSWGAVPCPWPTSQE